MTRRRPHHRRAHTTARSLIAFLLIASFGILFVGCSGPAERDQEHGEEFSFTERDLERFRELVKKGTGSLGVPRLELPDEGDTAPLEGEPPVLDLSKISTYEAIRSEAEGGEDVYRVVNEFLNVRAEPKVTGASLERLVRGDAVELIEFVDAAWAKVTFGSGKEGYVAQRYIAKPVTEEELAAEKAKYQGLYFVNFGFLNVRKTADAASEKIGELSGQALVKPLTMDKVWARIPFEGKEGYVAVEYLSPFLPNFLVRQGNFTLPILSYDLSEEGALGRIVEHVERLRQEGFTVLSLREFSDLLVAQEDRDVRLPPKRFVVALTGVTNMNVREVDETLRTRRIPATLFVETKEIGKAGITEKDILTLIANGFDVESAGHTGDDFRSLTNAQLELELRQSRSLLEEFSGKEVYAILYPRGGVNDRVSGRAAEAGYLIGVGRSEGRTFSRANLLNIPSFTVSPLMTSEDVLKMVRGG